MPPTVFWWAITISLLISFAIDLGNVIAGGEIDLRNRVTGIRLMAHGIDAYTYKWQRDDPDVYGDVYNNPKLPISKTTASPALLMLHYPLGLAPYRVAEFLWLAAQWLMLLGTGWLWWRAGGTVRARQLMAIFLAAFTYTAAWRLHAERGQAYILLVLIFAAWLALTRDPVWGRRWSTGLLAGFLIALRPSFVLLLPFLILHRRAQLLGAALGLAASVIIPLFVQFSSWSDYAAAMQTNSELYRNDVDPRPGEQHYPAEMEGMSTVLLAKFAVIPYADSSVFQLLRALGVEHSWLGDQAVPAWPPLLAVSGAFALWLVWTQRRDPAALLAGMAGWIFIVDFFLPAFRDSYNDVLILDVVAAGLVAGGRIPWAAWPCAASLPAGILVYVFAPEDRTLINLPTALLAVGAVMFVVGRGQSRADVWS